LADEYQAASPRGTLVVNELGTGDPVGSVLLANGNDVTGKPVLLTVDDDAVVLLALTRDL